MKTTPPHAKSKQSQFSDKLKDTLDLLESATTNIIDIYDGIQILEDIIDIPEGDFLTREE